MIIIFGHTIYAHSLSETIFYVRLNKSRPVQTGLVTGDACQLPLSWGQSVEDVSAARNAKELQEAKVSTFGAKLEIYLPEEQEKERTR